MATTEYQAEAAGGPSELSGVLGVLLSCPFCGRQPEVKIEPVTRSLCDAAAWTFINCGCAARPHVGKSCSTGYYEDNLAGNEWVTTRTDEDASRIATERAAKEWNTRAPNAEITGG